MKRCTLAFVLLALPYFSSPLIAQQMPSLAAQGAGYVLTIPYLEYVAAGNRVAYSATLASSDLRNFDLDATSVRSQSLIVSPVNAPQLTASASGFVLSLPYLDLAGSGRAYSARLNGSVPTRYVVDTTSVAEVSSGSLASPTNVKVAAVDEKSVGSSRFGSSTRLSVSWVAPAGYQVDHYEINGRESTMGTQVRSTAASGASSATLADLKSATTYAVTVKACRDAACSQYGSASANGTTAAEYWQLQGSGSTTAGLTRIVSDGNVRISATRIGSDAGTANAGRIQLYYGPRATTTQHLAVAQTNTSADAANASSYLAFASLTGRSGLISPSSGATTSSPVSQVATGQGVPLAVSMGGGVRLFFEATGGDGKTRIFSVDSKDGYLGQDFNAGSAATCSTAGDYAAGGGCAVTQAVGVEADGAAGNAKIVNARQHKVAWPTQSDWRWDGAAGTFMVFTTDQVSGCSTSNMNHGYAVWNGSAWQVQYDAATGCPKLFRSVQACLPMHLGEARYKMYCGDPSQTAGRVSGSSMPFLGPKRLIYADGASSGAARVDFEDWEAQSAARDVVFLWPSGEVLNDAAEGYIDDYHFLAPTGSLDLQVMYLAITNGTEIPFGSAALLLNP